MASSSSSDSYITRGFGRMHEGLALAASEGTPVVAASDGVVTHAGWHDGGYGNLLTIRHAHGLSTVRAWVASLTVTRVWEAPSTSEAAPKAEQDWFFECLDLGDHILSRPVGWRRSAALPPALLTV